MIPYLQLTNKEKIKHKIFCLYFGQKLIKTEITDRMEIPLVEINASTLRFAYTSDAVLKVRGLNDLTSLEALELIKINLNDLTSLEALELIKIKLFSFGKNPLYKPGKDLINIVGIDASSDMRDAVEILYYVSNEGEILYNDTFIISLHNESLNFDLDYRYIDYLRSRGFGTPACGYTLDQLVEMGIFEF